MILLWDLIEESPLLTDEQRLRITQEFAGSPAHFYVPGSRFVGDRHATYQSLMVYCRARYFSKYYPHPAWEAGMAGAASHFASLAHTIHIDGPQDTPDSGHAYVNTGYEPMLSYMLISGDRRGLESGMLGTILRGYDGLISGERGESTLGHQSLSFANKAAYLTGDARFVYYRNLASKDTDGFRIGQSFWPDRPERAPDELANRIVVRPLSDVGLRGAVRGTRRGVSLADLSQWSQGHGRLFQDRRHVRPDAPPVLLPEYRETADRPDDPPAERRSQQHGDRAPPGPDRRRVAAGIRPEGAKSRGRRGPRRGRSAQVQLRRVAPGRAARQGTLDRRRRPAHRTPGLAATRDASPMVAARCRQTR